MILRSTWKKILPLFAKVCEVNEWHLYDKDQRVLVLPYEAEKYTTCYDLVNKVFKEDETICEKSCMLQLVEWLIENVSWVYQMKPDNIIDMY